MVARLCLCALLVGLRRVGWLGAGGVFVVEGVSLGVGRGFVQELAASAGGPSWLNVLIGGAGLRRITTERRRC